MARRRGKPSRSYFTWQPSPAHELFARHSAREVLYGGRAGVGKTAALLQASLEYVHVPGYAACIVRRTYPQLSAADGPMTRLQEWLAGTDAKWSEQKHRWTFPSGAILDFKHLQHEKNKYDLQGAAYQFFGFDELTQFSLSQYLYLAASRARRKLDDRVSPIPIRIRSTSNPGGIGHEWVKARFVDAGHEERPEWGREQRPKAYIPGRREDNPVQDWDDYLTGLSEMDATSYAQLAEGKWVRDTGGLIYPVREANLVPELPDMPRQGLRWTLGIDLGSSERTPTTAMVALCWHDMLPGVFVARSRRSTALSVEEMADRIAKWEAELTHDGFTRVVVDEGGLGSLFSREVQKRYRQPMEPAKKASKLGFRKLMRGALEKAELMIVDDEGGSNGDLLDEMGSLSWNEDGDDAEEGVADHLTDALLYGWRACTAYRYEPPAIRLADPIAQQAKEERERDVRAHTQRAKRRWWAR